MPTPHDPGELVRIARLYYVGGRSQAEIGRIVDSGRSDVSRMLAEAQRRGIVEIRLHDPAGRVPDLEDRPRDAFGISDARVATRSTVGRIEDTSAPSLPTSPRVRQGRDHGGAVVGRGLAGHRRRGHPRPRPRPGPRVTHRRHGGRQPRPERPETHTPARRAAGGVVPALAAPATLESAASRDALLTEPTIAGVLDLARGADLALVGIGTPTFGSSAAGGAGMNLSAAEEQAFWAATPVGDLAGRFYDGHAIPGPADDRLVAVSLADLDGVPR